MTKYLTLLKLSWQNGLVYRLSLFTWRLRQFLSSLMSLTVWTVIFTSNNNAFGYSQDNMITYIFLIAFLQSIIIASSLNGLAQRIYSGEISNHLLKPFNIFAFFAIEEIADKVKNTFFLIFETFILFLLFKPLISFPDFKIFSIFLIWCFGGLIMNFFISLLFGSLGFWSPQVWGPKFLFFMILEFTAGKLFPLDILPKILQKIIFVTPFPYLSFLQIQLFLGRLNSNDILHHSLIFITWIILLGLTTKYIWAKGLRSYEATGQ